MTVFMKLIVFIAIFWGIATLGSAEEVLPDLRRTTVRENLQNLGNLFSGNPDMRDNASLRELMQQPVYRLYQEQIRHKWSSFERNIAKPMRAWSRQNLTSLQVETVVYPFSGPDLPNALMMFPDAKTYIFLALEPSGLLPDIRAINHEALILSLLYLDQSLESFSEENFFYTTEMHDTITKNPYLNGIVIPLVTFLRLMGYEVLTYRPFVILLNGRKKYLTAHDIATSKEFSQGHFSMELTFRAPRGIEKTLIFLSGDVSSQRFLKKNPGIFSFLNQYDQFITFIKAGSYLLQIRHYRYFKNFLMRKSMAFVMDDTGPAIDDFLATGWTIQVFGEYKGTIPLFANRFQAKLKEIFEKQKPQPLGFPFGYGNGARIILCKNPLQKR